MLGKRLETNVASDSLSTSHRLSPLKPSTPNHNINPLLVVHWRESVLSLSILCGVFVCGVYLCLLDKTVHCLGTRAGEHCVLHSRW